jgi:filamentous hemagglutinin family protein
MSVVGDIWRQMSVISSARVSLAITISGVSIFWANCTLAQSRIIPDNTLGAENSRVILNVGRLPVEVINGGAIRGQNLFHSFLEFNVSQGRGAYFFSPSAGIQNIVARVTGSNRSEILGLLGTVGSSNPNLFLINPNGIVFGRNASLNVGGSFLATTANGIQFGNQGVFSASVPNNPALLTVNPTALFYNQIVRSASIQNSSQASVNGNITGLQVPNGNSLLLVGGDITMDGGRLRAYGGHVELGGLASPGTVGIGVDGNNLSLSFPTQSTRASVSLINGTSVNVVGGGSGSITINANNLDITGGSSLIAGIGQGLGSVGAKAGDVTLNATGDVKIDGNGSGIANYVQQQSIGNGGNITLSSNSLGLTGGAYLQADTFGQGNAGSVIVNATKSVSLNNGSIFTTIGSASNSQNNLVKGNGGNIQITTGQLSLTNGAQLLASTYGQGNAGNITLNATGDIKIDGNGSFIANFVGQQAIGNAGNITIQITADQLSLTGGSQLVDTTFGQGNAGSIIINAPTVTLNGIGSAVYSNIGDPNNLQNNLAIGNGGNIQINTDQLSLTKDAQLAASTFGQGNAGSVIINAVKSVSLDSGSTVFSSVGSANNTQNSRVIGNGGEIEITTDQLSLSNLAGLVTNTYGKGNAGNVVINASSFSVTSTGQLTAVTYGQGNAGNVTINATKSVSLDGGYTNSNGSFFPSGIFSIAEVINSNQNSLVKGNGGNIQINTSELKLANGSQLSASTYGQGDAGNVIINATKSVSLDGSESDIFSTVGSVNNSQNNFAVGKGGNIQITTDQLSLTNGAQLQGSTFGRGNAGNVIINAPRVTLNGSSVIFSTVGTVNNNRNNLAMGNGGNIAITTDQLSLYNGAGLVASTYGQGNAGNVVINATKSVSLNGKQTAVTSGVGASNDTRNDFANGKGGTIEITTDQLQLSNGAQLRTNTFGRGNAGNVIINATKSLFLDNGTISSTVGGAGSNQNNLAKGNSGNIRITTDQFSLSNGSQLLASTYGQGDAGDVIVNATKSLSLNGNNTGIISGVGTPNDAYNDVANGKGGTIEITTDQLQLSKGAELRTSSYGQGDAGNIKIAVRSLGLDLGAIKSQTNSGNGGDINLTAQEYILLRNNSLISTNAGTARAGGNGGNITINTPFVIAFPQENSDITANAFSGSGGRVSINATNLFNIAPLSRQDLERLLGTNDPTKLDPQQLPTNDITAVSQQNADLNGTVQIRTPDIDPSRSLVTIPTVVNNPPKLVSSNCRAFNEIAGGSNFTITGRGGLPPSPDEPLTSDAIWSDTRLAATTPQKHQPKKHVAKIKPKPIAIVPATGWVFNDKGEVTLISSVSNTTSTTPMSCPAR